ncbi:MAG: oligosaccharide flippase family protein [Planctomycetales bacterium]|nr:oligosaccharide flippase family protein [Planctomycetales bacterium]
MRPSQFVKNVALLASSAVFAQAIPVALSPVISRLYDPAQFGVFAVFMSAIAIISPLTTGRYDIPILLPRSNANAIAILCVALISTAAITLLLAIAVSIHHFVAGGEIIVLLLPLLVMIAGFVQCSYAWENRNERYRNMAASRIGRGVFLPISQLLLHTFGSVGLVCGQIIGEATAAAWLLVCQRHEIALIKSVSVSRIMRQATKHASFPLYSVPAGLVNVFSAQMPLLLLSSFFSIETVGFYGFTNRVLAAPLNLIANAFLDVFKQQASRDFAADGSCSRVFADTFWKLAILSAPPFIVLGLFGPRIFSFVFGEKWIISGEFARALSILFCVRFVATPLSYVLFITGRQRMNLFWQIGLFVVTGAALAIGFADESVETALWAMSFLLTPMYVLNLWMSYRSAVGVVTR